MYSVALVAGAGWLGPDDERRRVGLRTRRSSQQIRKFIQLHIYHARGLRERLHFGVPRKALGLLHEFRPDWRSGLGASQVDFTVVIESYPHHAEQIAGVTRAPPIVGCTGLTGSRRVKPL